MLETVFMTARTWGQAGAQEAHQSLHAARQTAPQSALGRPSVGPFPTRQRRFFLQSLACPFIIFQSLPVATSHLFLPSSERTSMSRIRQRYKPWYCVPPLVSSLTLRRDAAAHSLRFSLHQVDRSLFIHARLNTNVTEPSHRPPPFASCNNHNHHSDEQTRPPARVAAFDRCRPVDGHR